MTPGPEWLDPVGDETDDQEAGAVEAALLTTYDPPDAELLVEDLLPRWFDLAREMSSDDAANRNFLAELLAELQRRRGKLAIFSSAALLGPENSHWIWSHVVRHFVGARGSVVQHAKLWLFHRVDNDRRATLFEPRLNIESATLDRCGLLLSPRAQSGIGCERQRLAGRVRPAVSTCANVLGAAVCAPTRFSHWPRFQLKIPQCPPQ